jgi:hypothetical protein
MRAMVTTQKQAMTCRRSKAVHPTLSLTLADTSR